MCETCDGRAAKYRQLAEGMRQQAEERTSEPATTRLGWAAALDKLADQIVRNCPEV